MRARLKKWGVEAGRSPPLANGTNTGRNINLFRVIIVAEEVVVVAVVVVVVIIVVVVVVVEGIVIRTWVEPGLNLGLNLG